MSGAFRTSLPKHQRQSWPHHRSASGRTRGSSWPSPIPVDLSASDSTETRDLSIHPSPFTLCLCASVNDNECRPKGLARTCACARQRQKVSLFSILTDITSRPLPESGDLIYSSFTFTSSLHHDHGFLLYISLSGFLDAEAVTPICPLQIGDPRYGYTGLGESGYSVWKEQRIWIPRCRAAVEGNWRFISWWKSCPSC